MATRQWFEYVSPKTGRKEFECTAYPGQNVLAGMIVDASGITDGEMKSIARGVVWAALSADADGHKVLPRGVRRTTDYDAFVQAMARAVDAGYVIEFLDAFSTSINSEDVDDKADVDENPTGTSPESL
jgi:hypothetical protein